MNTKELIAELQRLDPTGTAKVDISIRANRAYPVAYVTPFCVENYTGSVRVCCALPTGMHVVQRKFS